MSQKEQPKEVGNKIVAPELVYATSNVIHSNYSFNRLVPQSGSQDVTITATATSETLIEIPTVAHNLAQSYLSFDLDISKSNTPGDYNWYYTDVIPIQQMQLYTRNGQYLADVNYWMNYMKVVPKRELSIDKFLALDQIEVLKRCNVIASSNIRHDNTSGDIAYTEPDYIAVSGDNAATGAMQYKLPLFLISNTIFSINKTLKFADVIVLRIVWSPLNRFAWKATSAANPTTGAGDIAATVVGNVKNLNLYLAVETHPMISTDLNNKIASGGLRLNIPYVYCYKTTLGANGTVTTRWNRGHGSELRKIYTTLFNTAENKNTNLDHSNVAGAKVESYYTMLDSNRIQQVNIDAKTKFEDYMYNKKFLQESLLQSRNVYQYNWFHLDDFSGDSKNATELAGIPLGDREIRHDFVGLTSTAGNAYTFAVCDKELVITAQGVSVQ